MRGLHWDDNLARFRIRHAALVVSPSSVRSILILRYSALGDVVLATSVLDPLRARFPNARIEWLVDSAYAGLLEGLPGLDRVHGFRPGRGGVLRLWTALAGRFDLAVDLQNKLRTRLLSLAAADKSVRFVRRSLTEALCSMAGRDLVLQRAHATQLYAEALRPLGIHSPGKTRIALSARGVREADQAMRTCTSPAIAISPGSRWATKRWAPERFAQIADVLHARGYSIALVGGPMDAAVLNAFRQHLKAPLSADLTGLSVEGLAACLRRCKLLISCDSGPSHLAGALGVPAVTLFGPTSPTRWGPLPPGRPVWLELSCSPCTNHGTQHCPLGHHLCMTDLSVERVIAAVDDLLSRWIERSED